MEKNRNENDILGGKESRFSGEERARMAEEYAGRRAQRSKSQLREREDSRKASDGRSGSAKKERKGSEKSSGSRNERVRNSTQQRKKDKKRQSYIVIAMLFLVAAALVGVLTATVLRINTIEVTGTDNYSDRSVLDAAQLKISDSMLLINMRAMEEKIETKLPFIEEAVIKRKWPDKVIVTLTDTKPTLAIDTGEGYILMNNSCKVLTASASSAGTEAAIINGLKVLSAEEGKTIEFGGDISTADFVALTNAFEENSITGISSFELGSISNISVILDHRIEIRLGTLAGSVQRFAFLSEVIKQTIESDKKHAILIDVAADGTAYVRNKDDNNVIFGERPVEENTDTGETTDAFEEETTLLSVG